MCRNCIKIGCYNFYLKSKSTLHVISQGVRKICHVPYRKTLEYFLLYVFMSNLNWSRPFLSEACISTLWNQNYVHISLYLLYITLVHILGDKFLTSFNLNSSFSYIRLISMTNLKLYIILLTVVILLTDVRLWKPASCLYYIVMVRCCDEQLIKLLIEIILSSTKHNIF